MLALFFLYSGTEFELFVIYWYNLLRTSFYLKVNFMNQELQAFLFFTIWMLGWNYFFFSLWKGVMGEEIYIWRSKRNLIIEGVSKEDYVKKMRKTARLFLVIGNAGYLLMLWDVLFK